MISCISQFVFLVETERLLEFRKFPFCQSTCCLHACVAWRRREPECALRIFKKIEMFFCRKSNPNNGLVRLVMTMKLSLKKMSPTSNWSSIVVLGVSKCPFAANFWKSGGDPSFRIVCGANNRFFCRSASRMRLFIPLASKRPSMVNFPKSIRKYSILFLFFK